MNMDKNIENKDNDNLLQHREEFETVYGMISADNEEKVIESIQLAQIPNVLILKGVKGKMAGVQ